jgi:tetratricopeptide (TPR) repeat protein
MTLWIQIGESGHDVIEATAARRGQEIWARGCTGLQRLLQGLATVLEWGVGPRGLALAFLVAATALVLAGWLRPPLSPDLRSIYLPLGLWQATLVPEEILHGPRRVPADSAGIVLLVLIAAGAAAVVRRPECLGVVAGLLLCGALAANAALVCNHPTLIEMLDREYEQRRQIASMSAESPEGNPMSPEENPMAAPNNGRVGLAGAPVADEQRADLVRGWVYLLYGYWLVPWAVAGIFFGSPGPLSRRLVGATLWAALGSGVAGLVCFQRLHAEYYWCRARALEGEGDAHAAREALRMANTLFPPFEHLERTWLLAGKLDYRQKRPTPFAHFFQAYQLARDKVRARAVAYQQDFPWQIARTQDYREGLYTPPAGYDRTLTPGLADTGTLDARVGHHLFGLEAPSSTLFQTYWFANTWELRKAILLMEELLARGGEPHPAVRHQTARLWTDLGLHYYLRGTIVTDAGLVYSEQDRRLMAAQAAWLRASQISPAKRDSAFYLGMVQTRADRLHPELVEASFAPLLTGLADRALRADVLNVLGDAYFEAGRMIEARRRYVESFDVFNLPGATKINYRAQRRLGGL